MADYPANYPVFTDLNGQTSLAANNHAARHNKVHAEVLALSQRVGKTGDTDNTTHEYKLGDVSGAYKAETQGNKNTSTSLTPANDTVYPTNKAVKTYVDAAIATAVSATKQAMYPVGSLYYNATDATNPATLLGFGTWVAFATGQVPVGIDTGQVEFATPGLTGGDKNMQSHTHTRGTMEITGAFWGDEVSRDTGTGTSGAFGFSSGNTGGFFGGGYNYRLNNGFNFVASRSWTGATSSAGTGNSQNLQPYVVVYIWKRTA